MRLSQLGYREERHLAADALSLKLEVSEVLNSEPCGGRQQVEPALGHGKDVLDDLVWRADLSVAVVPGELREL